MTLQPGERLVWEGKPAPRCYTFRHWPHSLFGLLLLPLALVWMDGGATLAEARSNPLWRWLPWGALAVALWFLAGHLVLARLRWRTLLFIATDRRLLVLSGRRGERREELPLEEVCWFRFRPHGEHLGSLLVRGGGGQRPLALPCIEHPEPLLELLRASVATGVQTTP